MKLTGRRESSNVEDRRGLSGGAKAGIGGGIGAVIIGILFSLFNGGQVDVGQIVSAVQQQVAPAGNTDPANFSEEEQQLAKECKQILASTRGSMVAGV